MIINLASWFSLKKPFLSSEKPSYLKVFIPKAWALTAFRIVLSQLKENAILVYLNELKKQKIQQPMLIFVT